MHLENKQYRFYSRNLLSFVISFCILSVLFSCATTHTKNLVRDAASINVVPEVKTDVPARISEVREIKNHVVASEKGHTDMHFGGQIFTKSMVNGTTQIIPCIGCNVQLNYGTDTISTHGNSTTLSSGNLTTDNNGFFQLHSLPTTLSRVTVSKEGYNSVQLYNLTFTGGINIIKVILANGTSQERFVVSKSGTEFTWSKTQ